MTSPSSPARIAPVLAALLRRPGWLHLAMLGVAMLLTMLIVLLAGDKLQQWDERIASFSWSLADPHTVERRVVIVDIDEKSIAAVGAWPWPRAKQAELLEKLDQAGVGLKMLDILFEGRSSDDARLARALASPVPTVQAQLFSLQPEPHVRSGQLLGALPTLTSAAAGCPEASERAYGYMGSDIALPPGTLARAGHITPQIDPDGTIRRVPALVCYDGQTYPTLTLAGLLAANDGAVQPALRRGTGLLDPVWWLDMGALRLPLNETGQLRVSYQIPRTGFISISATDILQNKAPAELLRGAWVLVGATAFGARDAVPTPLGRAVSGVEIHAQLLSAMLDERSPYVPRGAALWPWLAGAIGSLLLLTLLRRNTFLQGTKNRQGNVLLLPLSALLLILALQATSTLLLLEAHLWLGWSIPGIYLLLATSLLGVAELARTRYERGILYLNLASYLPEAVAREVALALHEPSAQVRATRREATVLYADLRNFSAYCEGRPPEETAMVLHLFFTTASRVIEAHGGVLEQMVGDSLLATWNGSTPCENHNERALEAAVALWQACEPQLPRIDIASNKIPPLDLGIGIESGTVLIGSYGPAARRTHAVLGETVTLATRLQALTAELAYPILIGPGVTITITNPKLIKLGEFLIDGFSTARILRALPVERPTARLQLVHDASRQTA